MHDNHNHCEHNHDHSHGHSHNHDHSHSHDHAHPHTHSVGELHGVEKELLTLKTLLSHWVDHNASHKEGYDQWIAKTETMGCPEVGAKIAEAVELMVKANEKLIEAKNLMK